VNSVGVGVQDEGGCSEPGASSFVYAGGWMMMHPLGSLVSFSAIVFMSTSISGV
jgi:hypothetical protein